MTIPVYVGSTDAATIPPFDGTSLVAPKTAYDRLVSAAGELRDDKDAAEKALQDLRDILDARELEAQRQVDEAKAGNAAELDRLRAEHAKAMDELSVAHEISFADLHDRHADELIVIRSDAEKLEQHIAALTDILGRVTDQCNAWVARTGKDLGASLYADAGRQILDLTQPPQDDTTEKHP